MCVRMCYFCLIQCLKKLKIGHNLIFFDLVMHLALIHVSLANYRNQYPRTRLLGLSYLLNPNTHEFDKMPQCL